MKTKRTALSLAAAGTAAGVTGLVLLASPAGAGAAPPNLPAVSPEALVQSVLTTHVPAMAGSVTLTTDIGLPIPGLPGGDDKVRIFTDGNGRAKVLVPNGESEKAIVEDGTNLWIWNSADQSVTKIDHGTAHKDAGADGKLADPQTAASNLVAAMRKSSTVSVDGTGWVADRPVYELVLTPKPTERTLLREVRVAVDSQLRVPLQLEVFANGQSDPALKVGFTDFTPGAQDPNLFRFTPPAGATVTERKSGDLPGPHEAKGLLDQLRPKTVGDGWDTVLTGTLPADMLNNLPGAHGDQGKAMNPMALLKNIGKPVSGPFGAGTVIETKVGSLLVADNGRVAIGAVPPQVLIEALSK